MDNYGVVDISRKGQLSLKEAEDVVQIIRKLTEKYVFEVESKMVRLESMDGRNLDETNRIEAEVNLKIQEWHSKVRKLGGVPKGLWLVDLDSGNGYFCWKYPEKVLGFWHGYEDGFKNRIPLSETPNFKKDLISAEKNVVSTLL